jgi:exopolysaccharide biosynthesis polyprenyl glycosylphosphotransferase
MVSGLHSPAVRRISAFVNAAVVLLVLLGVFIGINWDQMPGGLADFLAMRITVKNLLVTVICLVGGASAFHVFGLTKPMPNAPFGKEMIRVTKACTVAAVFALLFPLTSHTGAFTDRIAFYFLPIAIVACLCGRLTAKLCMEHLAHTLNGPRDLIIVGSGSRAQSLYQQFQESDHRRFHVLGFVDSPNGHQVIEEIRRQLIGSLEELEGILMRQPVDEVLIALPAESCHAQIQTVITTCERAGVEAKYLLSDIFELSLAKPRFEPQGNAPVVSLKVVHDDARLAVKRLIDIAGALVGLTIFGPLMLIIAAAIRVTSPGPALFVQERYGLRKRRFRMYKFRTMVRDAEKLQAGLESQNEVRGPAFKIRNDPRITSIGRFLRKTSLDEFPQFLNVLKGEMSLVGPRPLPSRDVSRFDNAALMRRFSVKPGLTCLWQINGRSSNTDFESWITLDLKYIDEWSLLLDLAILAKTVPAVLRGSGAT